MWKGLFESKGVRGALLVIGVLVARQGLEFFESVPPTGIFWVDVSTFVHAAIFYIFFFSVIALCVAHFTGWTKGRAFKELVTISPLLLVAPVIDLLFFGRYGAPMSYNFVSISDFFTNFFSFFGPLTLGGVTLGMRVQVLGILGLVAYWVYKEKRSVGESVIATLSLYALIYIIASAPSYLGWLEWARTGELRMSIGTAVFSAVDQNVLRTWDWGVGGWMTILRFNMVMAQLWFLGIAGMVLWYTRKLFSLVYTKSRALRAGLYVGFMTLGTFIAPSYVLNVDVAITAATAISALVAALVAVLVWTYAFVVNDLYDVAADELVHKDRPLPQGIIGRAEMVWAGVLAVAGSVIGSCLLPWPSILGIATFLICATLYSVPPFQLRRFFAAPQLLMAIASVGILYFGFALTAKDALMRGDIRLAVAVGFLLFGFWFFKDIADMEGDRKAGYKTIMTVYGKEKGPWVAYGIFLSSTLVPMILFPSIIKIILWMGMDTVLFVCLKKGRVSEALIPLLLIGYVAVLFG